MCGKLFGCPHCENIINSDVNAVTNLAWLVPNKKWLEFWPEDKEERKQAKEEARVALLPIIQKKLKSELVFADE